MKARLQSCALLVTLLVALIVLATPAWAAKVKVCHLPPGNPANFHTITINDNALQAHLAHGDLPGDCSANCSTLCDDGNACTVDACDAAEHCLADHPPVSCDDGNLCTVDTCDPAAGCSSTPRVCADALLCTVDACDPLTGQCVFPPVDCPVDQTCDPDNGDCESNVCEPNPCLNGGECSDVGGVAVCGCPAGWTGPQCQYDIDECASSPCVNGDCIDQIAAYACSCYPGWTGTDCDVQEVSTYNCVDRNPCTPENIAAGLFYFPADSPEQFIQCSEYGQCYIMPCPPGLVWNQDQLTCTY